MSDNVRGASARGAAPLIKAVELQQEIAAVAELTEFGPGSSVSFAVDAMDDASGYLAVSKPPPDEAADDDDQQARSGCG